jgi:hypothetical protein
MAFKMKGMAIDKSPMPMKGHANTTAMYNKHTDEDDKKNDRQPPVQPGENPDTEVYEGGRLSERINDLEIRIENINEKYSNYDRPLTAKEKDAT